MDGKLIDLLGFGFIPRLRWRHRYRPWLGIVRVSVSGHPAQSRQKHMTDSHMHANYKDYTGQD